MFEIYDFSSNIDDIKHFIDKLNVFGGGDLPENLLGG